MPKSKPRLARLTAIVTQLQASNCLTASYLANKHQVSVRTIYRDIRTLEQSGIPIVTLEGKGYTLMDGFKLPPIMFTEAEANALITAEHLILKNTDASLVEQYQNAITKIKAVLRGEQKNKSEFIAQRIQVRNNTYNNKTSNYLIQLQAYIASFNVIEIKYLSLENKHTTRAIEPFALYTTNNNWILIAFCRKRQAFRAFRLDCIQEITKTTQQFTPHDFTLEEYLESCRKKYFPTPDIPLAVPQPNFTKNINSNIMEQIKIKPFNLIGIAVRTTNQNNQALEDISKLWQQFMQEDIANKIPNKLSNNVYSLYTHYQKDFTAPYTTILGCKVSSLENIPEGMVGESFTGGTYLKSSVKGKLTDGIVGEQWNNIWKMKLDRAYTADFEIYGSKAQDPTAAEVDFYIAINKEA